MAIKEYDMKKFIYTAIIAMLALSCSRENSLLDDIIGSWHMTGITAPSSSMTQDGSSITAVSDVWVLFYSDKTFAIYQKTGDASKYQYFKGKFTLDGSTISGTYSDGTAWGSKYKISVTDNVLTMEALNGSGEIVTYAWENLYSYIPDQVTPTKADGDEAPAFL